jgi:hypothetical protein
MGDDLMGNKLMSKTGYMKDRRDFVCHAKLNGSSIVSGTR